eukprot:6289067-Prymnesium_polylepis.3
MRGGHVSIGRTGWRGLPCEDRSGRSAYAPSARSRSISRVVQPIGLVRRVGVGSGAHHSAAGFWRYGLSA